MQTIGVISEERLKIEIKFLLSATRKSYIPRRFAQQRMTLSDLEWPFHASQAISAVAELNSCSRFLKSDDMSDLLNSVLGQSRQLIRTNRLSLRYLGEGAK